MSEDHRADRARLLAHAPSDGSAVVNPALTRALDSGERRWEENAKAYRAEPDPRRLDGSLAVLLSRGARDRLARALD